MTSHEDQPAAKKALGLKEAMDIYFKHVGLVQKFWGWLQVFAVGAVGIAWAIRSLDPGEARLLGIPLLLMYAIVAAANGTLLVNSQVVSQKTAVAIQTYLHEHPEEVDPAFGSLRDDFTATNPKWVGAFHAGIDLVVVSVIAYCIFTAKAATAT
jgi:hypothetical protein